MARYAQGAFAAVDLGVDMRGLKINTKVVDSSGNLWLASSAVGLLRLSAGKVTRYTATNGLPSIEVLQVLADARGRIWFVTASGQLGWVDGDRCQVLPGSAGLPDTVRAVAPAKDGGLWVGTLNSQTTGTRTSGLHQVVPRLLRACHLPAPHQQHIFLTVCARRDGSIWGGTDGAGVFRWQGVELERLGEEQGLPRAQINVLLEDSRTRLWVGTSLGLFQCRAHRFEALTNAAVRGNITALFEDRDATMWVGTARGLVGLGNAGEARLDHTQGVPAGQIIAAAQDHAGRFWVAVANRGLFWQEDGKTFKLWTVARGAAAPPSRWYDGGTTRRLLPEPDGSLWAASYGYGLFRLQGGRIRWWSWHYDGLPSNHLLSLQSDDAGNLWFSSENGLFGYARKALLNYKGSGSPRPIPIRLSKAEGLPYKVGTGAGQPASTRSADGRLWFPNGAALVSFNPTNTIRKQQTWPPIIEAVRADGSSRPIIAGQPVACGRARGISSSFSLRQMCWLRTASASATSLKVWTGIGRSRELSVR